MAFITKDFVKETSTVTGTGAIGLGGARTPAQTFAQACANGDTFHYAISHDSLNQWEVGLGTYNSGSNTITRTQVLRSSNSDNLVNFSAGAKKVDIVAPADRIITWAGPLVFGAGTASSGALTFSNSNGVSWGVAGNVVTASVGGGGGALSISAGASSAALASVVFSNSNGVSFGLNGSTVTGSVVNNGFLQVTNSSTSVDASRLVFTQGNGITFGLSTGAGLALVGASYTVPSTAGLISAIRVSAGTSSTNLSALTFSNSNGVSFGLNGSTVTGSVVTVNTDSFVGGMSAAIFNSSITTLTETAFQGGNIVWPRFNTSLDSAFSSANVFFRFNTGAVSTHTIMAAAVMFAHAGASSAAVQHVSFSNANGVSFGLDTTTVANSGRVAIITGSAAGGGGGGNQLRVSATNASGDVTLLHFNTGGGGNFTFGLSTDGASGGTITVSAFAVKFISMSNLSNEIQSITNATSNVINNQTIRIPTFSNDTVFSHANAAFRISGGATLLPLAWQSYMAGASTVPAQLLSFSNANGLTFNITQTDSAGFGRIVQVSGSYTVPAVVNSGLLNVTNAVSSVDASRLLLSNANGFSWLLNTAGSVATLSGSYTVPAATVFSNSNNVTFGLAGSTVTASVTVASSQGSIGVSAGANANTISALTFSNSNGVSFGLNAGTITASVNAGGGGGVTVDGWNPFDEAEALTASNLETNSLRFQLLGVAPNFTFDRVGFPFFFSNSTASTGNFTIGFRLGLYTQTGQTLSLFSSTFLSQGFTGTSSTQAVNSFYGNRVATFGWSTTLSADRYFVGLIYSSSVSHGGALQLSNRVLQPNIWSNGWSGVMGQASATNSLGPFLGFGVYSANTTGLPNSVGLTQIMGSTTQHYVRPAFEFRVSI